MNGPLKGFRGVCGALIITLILLFGFTCQEPIISRASQYANSDYSTDDTVAPTNSKLHILLPATNAAVDLCKTFLTGAILGYPTPTLIAFQQERSHKGLLGGGSHMAKIDGVLEYLEGMDKSTENDLIMMMDAYDIWFQLRPEVLISRFHYINRKANERLKKRLGNAYDKEHIRQKIIFGAGKRCTPNNRYSIACYPIPDAPLPDDLYGNNTDTIMGKNMISSFKQRYLNSGYIIGPQKDMLALFRRASAKVASQPEHDPYDGGSHGSDHFYGGSDQSVFNTIYGEQEYQREVLRRRHLSTADRLRGKAKPTPYYVTGALVRDPLNPDFTHEPGVEKEGAPDEFGIGLDFWSDLGHQTMNTEDDTRYLRYNTSIEEQLSNRHGMFDCRSRVTGQLPKDILSSAPPLVDLAREDVDWENSSLYTNVCLNTIPVMIHHNGDKSARHHQWHRSWMQPHARALMEQVWRNGVRMDGRLAGGANLPSGEYLGWQQLCAPQWEWELFRDVERPMQAPVGM